MSSLGVNFHKSSLIDINISDLFLFAAANLWSCKIEDKSFTFLGIGGLFLEFGYI